ncbi:DNA translocase FtsK, partial [Anaerostipes caccae]|nr:DNA translocase FtsK [Anaerostipes caccae]
AKEPDKPFDLDEMIGQPDEEVLPEEPELKPGKRSVVNREKSEPEPIPEISIHPSALEEGDYVFPPVTLLKRERRPEETVRQNLKRQP